MELFDRNSLTASPIHVLLSFMSEPIEAPWRHDLILNEIAGLCLNVARDLSRCAEDTENPERKVKLAGALHQMCRSIRQTLALQARLARHVRREGQKRAETRKLEVPHPWQEHELEAIETSILAEQARGEQPRYWEDVLVGDEIDTITKGPLGLTDFIAFIAGGAAPIPRVSAHSGALRKYHKHPKWAFRDPKTHALEPVYSVHYNDYAARLQGAQIAYDVGIQRTSWGIHALTHWMGDAGTVKEIFGQYRAHVFLGDVVRLGGRVEAKEVDAQGDHVVRLTTWAHNQRDQNVMPGTAVIALPSRGGDSHHPGTKQ